MHPTRVSSLLNVRCCNYINHVWHDRQLTPRPEVVHTALKQPWSPRWQGHQGGPACGRWLHNRLATNMLGPVLCVACPAQPDSRALFKRNVRGALFGNVQIVRSQQQVQQDRTLRQRAHERAERECEQEEADKLAQLEEEAAERRRQRVEWREAERVRRDRTAREEREREHKLEMARLEAENRSRNRSRSSNRSRGGDSGYDDSRSGSPYHRGQETGTRPWWAGHSQPQPAHFPPQHPPPFGYGYPHPPAPQPIININNVNGAAGPPHPHAQTSAAPTPNPQRGRSLSRSRGQQDEAHEILRGVRSGSKDVYADVLPNGVVQRGRPSERGKTPAYRDRDDSAYGGSEDGRAGSRSRSRGPTSRAQSRVATPHDTQSQYEEDPGYHSEYERSRSRGRDQRSRSTGPPPSSSSARSRSASSRSPGPQGASGPVALRNKETALVPHNKEQALVRHNSPAQTAGQGHNTQTALVLRQRRR